MNAPGDHPHDKQMLDYDSFLFCREKITWPEGCHGCRWIVRRFVLRAADAEATRGGG